MLKIAVLDNHAGDLAETVQLLRQYLLQKKPFLKAEVTPFSTGDELLEKLSGSDRFDLYYLEVLLPGLNGVEIAKKIREEDETAVIIFLSSTSAYMPAAFGVQAFHYLLKPALKNKDFYPVFDRAIAHLAHTDPFFIAPTKSGRERVPLSNIAYVENFGHRVYLHLCTGGSVVTAAGSKSLKEIAETLMEHPGFLLTHRAYLVNLRYVSAISRFEFVMTLGDHVPIARNRYRTVKQSYCKFLKKDANF